MHISSMTGFARENGIFEYQNIRYAYLWEIKSVNAKGMEVKMRLPQGFDDMEFEVKSALGRFFARGTFNLTLNLENQGDTSDVKIDKVLLESLKNETVQIYLEHSDVFEKPSPAELLSVFGVVSKEQDSFDDEIREKLYACLLKSLDEALLRLQADRQKEGEKIGLALMAILDQIEAKRTQAEKIAATSADQIKAKILEQIKTIVTDASITPERLEQEVLFYVMRADVKEELDRLKAHILTAREIFKSGGAIGRRLDFLCQELNREANTLCSKSMDLEQTKIGMDLKALIEQFREQIQNME